MKFFRCSFNFFGICYYVLIMEKQYLTQEKFDELKEELAYLTGTRRSEIAKELDQTGAMGDLRENAEYQQAREAQADLEQRISKLEQLIQNAEIVKEGKRDSVGVGSHVVLRKKGEKENLEYKIVGAEESSMVERKISSESPLVQAMLGMKKGEVFKFEAPSGKMEYEIVDIK